MTSVVTLLINKHSISLIKVTESMASTFIYMLDSTQDPGIHSMESMVIFRGGSRILCYGGRKSARNLGTA
jgi:hypothetical protein